MFTDVEGSTRRWQDDSAMGDTLVRHDQIIRLVVDSYGGDVVKHTGDGVMAVFGTAAKGLQAALDTQIRLHEEDWPGTPLKARIAVHTGEVDERDGDYFGPTVNLAARLMDAGHGGQVLVSDTTEGLSRTGLPAGASLLDLGEHRLRDVEDPMRVYQVVDRRIEERFPPLRSASTVRNNLPRPRTTFVGRQADLEGLTDLLDQRSLVTLVGVGGAGKTRLAVEAGRRLVRETRPFVSGGVYFADLSAVTDGAAVARAVAGALGMPPVSGPTATPESGAIQEEIVGFLRDRQVLLVLDNCEHMLDECADLVDELLAAAPSLTVLATSREALAVEGEQLWQVRSLSLPGHGPDDESEAMQLIVDRIQATQPEFSVGPDNREALVEICLRLDGIPLALELAAARIGHLSPLEVAQRLNDRFTLLTGGRRRSQRQQTLQAAIDWSYQLLIPQEQAVLQRLSVFSGPFSLEAAEGIAMTGIESPATDILGSLVDKSLVVAEMVEGQARYKLLETIRLYAGERLAASGDADATRSAHRDWYLVLLENQPYDQCFLSEELARILNREYGNLWGALEWCEAQDQPDMVRRLLLRMPAVFWRYGRFAEAQRWFDLAQAYERTLPRHDWFVHVLVEWIVGWRFTGDPAEAEISMARIEQLIDELAPGSPAKMLAHMTLLGFLAVFPRRADEWARQADLVAAEAGASFPLVNAWASWVSGAAYLYQKRYREADELLVGLHGSPEWNQADAAYIESTLALVRHLEGRQDEALRILDRGARWTYDAWMLFEEATAAAAKAASGDLEEGRDLMRHAISSIRESGWEHPLARSDCLVGLGALAAIEGKPEEASRLIAGIPLSATGTPPMWVLLRHYRDLVRGQLDPETRHRLIQEGQGTGVDEAIDSELARWETAMSQA